MKIVHAKTDSRLGAKNIFAAGNVFAEEAGTIDDFGGEDLEDAVDDFAAEQEEDLGEDDEQDSTTIDVENNITNHLIAECENCHGIFISAMLASDQIIESINGVCPLCNKDTEQTLRWIVKDYPEE